mmetsp:Transcript_2524/g.2829  ORF Transcript_2524/g.2829 Transcript_2524/m.2829 type:complete len:364 (+) Transcript_2524:2-1093(+)
MNHGNIINFISEGYQLKLPKGRPTMIEEPEDLNIDEVREAMKVNQVLLAFAWTSGEEKKMLSLFPELITFDVTEKTNKEKRGLFLAVGLDGMGKIFIPMHCFMPNSQMTSFHWVYKHAIPNLWGDEILKRVEVVITDGEHALYAPLDNLSKTTLSKWSGVSVQRCSFHLFTQEWMSIPRNHLSDEARKHLDFLKRWIDSWITNIDKEYQFLDSLQKFYDHIKSDHVTKMFSKTRNTANMTVLGIVMKLVKNMEMSSTKWAKCYKTSAMDLEQTTSSIGESANGSLKNFDNGKLASKTIATSAGSQILHSNHLNKKRDDSLAKDMNTTAGNQFMEQQDLLLKFGQELAFGLEKRKDQYIVIDVK